MSVTKTSSGRWNARYPVGMGVYKNKVFDKKTQAVDFEAKMRLLVKGGQYVDEKLGKQAVSDYAWSWYGLGPDTPHYRQNIRSHIKNHLVAHFGERPIATITQEDLQRLVRQMEKEMEPTSVRTVVTTIRMIFRYAAKKKVISEDPSEDLKLPKIVVREIRPLHIWQVHSIADAIFPRYRAVVLFAAGSGLRQGEVFGVKITDICWERGKGSVTVWNQIQSYTGAAQQETDSTKGRRDRTVPLDDGQLDLLRAHLASFPANEDGFIFTNTLGKPLHRRVFDRAFEAARRHAATKFRAESDQAHEDDPIQLALAYGLADQIEEAVFHSLRHFYASLLIRMGLSPKTVAARLGHANVSMTLGRYAHLWPDDDDRTRDAAKVLLAA